MKQLFCFDPEGNGIELGEYEDTWWGHMLALAATLLVPDPSLNSASTLRTHCPAVELLLSPLQCMHATLSTNPACLQALPAGAWRGERLAVRVANGWV